MALPHGVLLPLLSGLLLAASFPPLHLLFPSFLALVPFALHLRTLPADPGGGRKAFRAGAVMGLLYFGILLHWLIPALLWLSRLGPLLYIVVVVLLGGLLGMVGWAAHRLQHAVGVPAVLALPLAWTAGEWLRGHLPGGLAFPWLGLGTSLTGYPELVGFAELVGARGVTFWLVLVNALVAEGVGRMTTRGPGACPSHGVRSRDRRFLHDSDTLPGSSGRSWAPGPILVMLAGVAVLPPAWGVWRARTLPTAPVARLALAQTRVPAEVKADPERALEVTRIQLREMGFGDGTDSFGGLDLLVWPETTFPFPLSSRPVAVRDLVGTVAAEENAPVLFGAEEIVADRGSSPVRYNAAFLRSPSRPEGETGAGAEDRIRSVYRKRFLVPLVERSPRLLPSFLPLPRALFGGADDLAPGGESAPVPLPIRVAPNGAGPPGASGDGPVSDARFGILICFESAFPGASRVYRSHGADFLVNVSNDVWFGEGTWLPSRAGASQHAAHVVMRAVENRMGVARSANGGFTFFVDPLGRIHGRAPEGEAAVTVDRVAGSELRTLYSRTGDWVGPSCVAAVVALLLGAAVRGGTGRGGFLPKNG